MHISEAARAHAGLAAGVRGPHASERPARADAAGAPNGGRELDSRAATRVFAGAVLQRLTVTQAGRSEAAAPSSAQRPAAVDAVGTVAGALSSAATAGASAGADPVPGLLSKVEDGIASASGALERMGYDKTQVAQAALHFRERVSSALAQRAVQPGETGEAGETAAVSATRVRKERGSIELVTQDGDVVRIRFRSREAERVDIAGVRNADGSAVSARISTQQSARLKVAVSGDLDAGELKAIEDFLGKVDAAATAFYDGDVEAAFAAGAALAADPDEIARFSVSLSLSERASVAARVSGAPAGSTARPDPTPVPANGGASASSQPTTSAPGTPADAGAAPSPPAASTAEPGDAFGAQPAPQVGQAAPGTSVPQAASADPLATIRSFVQRVLSAARAPLAVHGVALEWQVKIELTAALFEARRPQQAAAPAEQMFDQIMERAAAHAGAQASSAVA
jgi:hypothetical protein